MTENNNEEQLMLDCLEVFRRLNNIIQDKDSDEFEVVGKDTVTKLFHAVDGKVNFKSSNERAINFDGFVAHMSDKTSYTISGVILYNMVLSGFNILAENLTMAYYKMHDGNRRYNTSELIKILKRM